MTQEGANIHERAIVHPNAKVGKGTVVGPDVVIDEHVEVGEDCEIRPRAVITGHTKVGSGNQIGYGAVIGAEPQDLAYDGALSYTEVGDKNVIREYVTIHRGTKEGSVTKVGSGTMLMVGAHVAHNCYIHDGVILVNNVLLGGYVEVFDRAFLGGAVVVHQFTRIGHLSMVRGQTRLGMDVPPFCMAVSTNSVCGLNRIGLKRGGLSMDDRKQIQRLYDLLYHSGKNREQALEMMQESEQFKSDVAKTFAQFVGSTRRGLCRSIKGRGVFPD